MNSSISIGIGIAVTKLSATTGDAVPDGALFIDDAATDQYFTDDALANPFVTKD